MSMVDDHPEQVCRLCRERSSLVAGWLGLCLRCIRECPERALSIADEAHTRARRLFGLPERPPRAKE